jgi:cyclomaltodextrin glucanotransferase
LQRGLQLNLLLQGERAAFYRVYQHEGVNQTALVLLNKGDEEARFDLGAQLQPGTWRNGLGNATVAIGPGAKPTFSVGAHGVAVWLLDQPLTVPELRTAADQLMRDRERRTSVE